MKIGYKNTYKMQYAKYVNISISIENAVTFIQK